ncbi:MAG: hypothetical protein J6W28_08230, partial [Clostridia bacterium]|nr:hypothetical protein [Clostridia bacterium]
MDALKVVFILAILFLLFFPLLPLPLKLKRFSTFRALRYDHPHNRLNLAFVILSIVEIVVLAVLYTKLFGVVEAIVSVPFIERLLNNHSTGSFILAACSALLLNLVTLYALVVLKAFFKGILNAVFGFRKNKKKKKKKKGEDVTEKERKGAKKERKLGRIGRLLRSKRKKGEDEDEDEDEAEAASEEDKPLPERVTTAQNEKFQKEHPVLFRIYRGFWGLFFEKPDFVYARRYVFTAVTAIQFFVYLLEILYAVLFLAMLVSVFYPVDFLSPILEWTLKNIYIYPFVSLLLLQELCNTFRSACKEPE